MGSERSLGNIFFFNVFKMELREFIFVDPVKIHMLHLCSCSDSAFGTT